MFNLNTKVGIILQDLPLAGIDSSEDIYIYILRHTIMKSHIVVSSNDIDTCVLRNIEQGMESLYIIFEFIGAAPFSLVVYIA